MGGEGDPGGDGGVARHPDIIAIMLLSPCGPARGIAEGNGHTGRVLPPLPLSHFPPRLSPPLPLQARVVQLEGALKAKATQVERMNKLLDNTRVSEYERWE